MAVVVVVVGPEDDVAAVEDVVVDLVAELGGELDEGAEGRGGVGCFGWHVVG